MCVGSGSLIRMNKKMGWKYYQLISGLILCSRSLPLLPLLDKITEPEELWNTAATTRRQRDEFISNKVTEFLKSG